MNSCSHVIYQCLQAIRNHVMDPSDVDYTATILKPLVDDGCKQCGIWPAVSTCDSKGEIYWRMAKMARMRILKGLKERFYRFVMSALHISALSKQILRYQQ